MTANEFLARENAALRRAGCKLAEAALHVIREYDGTHRLALAVAEWAQTIADEGGRPHRQPAPERDDTAALVAAVESGLHYIKWAEEHGHMGAPSSRTLIEAVLARVKGGELGEGWDEPYAHRDPGNARPARTARKAKGER